MSRGIASGIVTMSLCLLIQVSPAYAGNDSLLVLFWNLENFFDWRDSGAGDSDREFSSFGERRWTKGRFYTKCNAVAKALLWTGSRCGRMPDVVGFAEVENGFVLNSILKSTALRKYGYEAVHYDSPDPRGIDVALVYRREIFKKISARPVRVSGSPVFNAKGELIGTAFDRNYEGLTGDIAFRPSSQRAACVDIRYTLFIIEKYAGASHIIDELSITE